MVKDHLGNEFNSYSDMCRSYGVGVNLFHSRLKLGWSLERALLSKNCKCKEVKDHIGNSYSSQNEMCRFYGIKVCAYRSRINSGWSLEKALTYKVRGGYCVDPFGNRYSNVSEMCRKFGIKTSTYCIRRENGKSLVESLCKLSERKVVYRDSNGLPYYICKISGSEEILSGLEVLKISGN